MIVIIGSRFVEASINVIEFMQINLLTIYNIENLIEIVSNLGT